MNGVTQRVHRGLSASPQRRGRTRHGSTFLECVTALFVLGVAFTTAVQLLAASARQLQRIEDRDRATLAASNVLERLVRVGIEIPTATHRNASGEWDWPEPTPILDGLSAAKIVVETVPATIDVDELATSELFLNGIRDISPNKSSDASSDASPNASSNASPDASPDAASNASPDAASGRSTNASQGRAPGKGRAVGQRIRVSVVGPGERGTRHVYASLTAWKFPAESRP
jgi:hypothetical protein